MILDEDLPAGLSVNTAGVLALTLGDKMGQIIGPDVTDGSGRAHLGITTMPIPILKAGAETVREIRLQASELDELMLVDFTDAAQSTKTYEDYTRKIEAIPTEELSYLGLALYGDKKRINKLTGSLPLLR
ncbi:MAG: DUF2000 domain-containing protein [Rubrobacter sp.]|jgi:hypothetical protein|nr:DUF2000 domain-containing protein [Rubrobacter sp.]